MPCLLISTAAADTNISAAIKARLEKIRPELIELRHDLHRHPELSGKEERTAAVVEKRLRALGLTVRTNVGGHGVVGVLQGGKPGPVVAYRADMDAIQTDAPDPAEFRSTIPGVRHMCGHDVHTAIGLGIAEALTEVRSQLTGSVKFIFQPAEETVEGAKAMIRDGVLENPKPNAIFALHTSPQLLGTIGCPQGLALPGSDVATIRLKGTGDLPKAAREMAMQIRRLTKMPMTDMSSLDPAKALLKDFVLCQMGPVRLEGNEAILKVEVRASSETNYAQAKGGIQDLVSKASTADLNATLEYEDRRLPDTINDPALVAGALKSIAETAGKEAAIPIDGTVPFFGEDFSFFQKQIPGAMFWVGVSSPEKNIIGMPHAPFYQADDRAIEFGAWTMANVLVDYLREKGLSSEK